MEDDLYIEGELVSYERRLSPNLKSIEILPISDAHYGNPLFSKKHFLSTIKYIKEKHNAFTFLNGDLCESAIRTSLGEIYRQVGSPQDQRDWMIEMLYPIRKKVLGSTLGNHENRIYRDVGLDICKDIATALEIPYRASGMLLKILFGSGNNGHDGQPYISWGYFTHGYGGARTKSAKAVKVERLANFLDADWHAMSHDHVVNIAPDVYLEHDYRTFPQKDENGKLTGFNVGKVTQKRRMLIKTNAYLKWGGYAEMGGFPPVDLETPIIKITSDGAKKLKVKVEV